MSAAQPQRDHRQAAKGRFHELTLPWLVTAPFLILRGAPGSGKSTVAALLRSRFPNGVTIEVDTLRAMVHGNPWGSATHHRRAVGAAAQLALHYKDCGYHPILIVDTLGGGTADLLG